MSAHAKLSASAAHRWMRCPGSVRLSKGRESSGSMNAAEGTFAHEIAAAALNNVQKPQLWLGKKRIVDDKFEVECTQEMVDAVDAYVEMIDDELNGMDKWFVEVDLTPALSKLHPSFGGTADFMRYRPSKKHLRVVDLKYGAGVLVDVEDNEQLKVYALGALLTLGLPCSSVTVAVFQPRAEHPEGRLREVTFPAIELTDFAADMVAAANVTALPDAPLVPGEKQCQWCPAKAVCPELEKQQHALVAADFAEPTTLTADKIAQALQLFPAVKARMKAIEEEAYTRAEQGATIPGFKLVDKRPTRKWQDEGKVIEWCKQNAIDPWEPAEIASPAQLEKRAAEFLPKGEKKKAKELLAPFVVSLSNGHALVPVSDDRPEVKRVSAEDFQTVDKPAESVVSSLF